MVNFIITGMVAVFMIAICCCYLKFDSIKEKKSLIVVLPKDIKQALFGMGMIISTVLVVVILCYLYEASWVFAVKRVVVCASLWPIALIDYRKHIIPNRALCFMLIVRSIILVSEMVYDFKSIKTELLSCLIAGAGILILLCLMRLIVKDGIGFGDIKLFTVMGLFFGIKGILPTVFLSFVVSFIVSIYMLITKRKSKKGQLAFAPSILVGTLLSVIIFGA